jgi:6-phosphogluconolactonase
MNSGWLRASVFALLVVSAGCGSSPMGTSNPLQPSCVPSLTPSFAYVLTGATSGGGNGTISSFTANSCTGVLAPTSPATIATGINPEDMVVDPLGRFVYVANLVSNASDEATISMYTINPSTGVLTPTSPATVPTGFLPQGITIDPSGRFVYTANSDDNTVSMFTVNQTTGVLTPTSPSSVAAGWSPDGVTVDPTGRFAYATNQDDATVSMYAVNSTTGVLTPTTPATVATGASPFEITVDPAGKFAYVPNTYSANNSVSEFAIDPASGVLTPTAQGQILAGDSPTSVAIDATSTHAYIVNRGANTVNSYAMDPNNGSLTLIATTPTGLQPWRIAVDPSGTFVYVGNEEDGTVSIFNTLADGKLTSSGDAFAGGSTFVVALVKPNAAAQANLSRK